MTAIDPAQRLAERLDVEEALLTNAFPNAKIDRPNGVVVLADYGLPAGWTSTSTDVMFQIPANYPAGCPDNVCVRPDLRLANGEMPGNQSGVIHCADREWLQLSWHFVEQTDWVPTADASKGSNLVTYLLSAVTRFDEAS